MVTTVETDMAPNNVPNQSARRSASQEEPCNSPYDNGALNVQDIYDEDEDEDQFVEKSPSHNPRNKVSRRNAMNVHDIRLVRKSMDIHDIYDDEDGEDGDENSSRVYHLSCDVAPTATTGSLLDISAELEVRDIEDPWKEEDPWKSTDSLCQLVDLYTKDEEHRKISISGNKAMHPRVADLKRTWRSTESLSNLIESTTNSIRQTWKSSDTLSNLVEKYTTPSSNQSSHGSKFQSVPTSQSDKIVNTSRTSRSSYGSKFSSTGTNHRTIHKKPSTPLSKPGDEIVAGDDILIHEDSYYETSTSSDATIDLPVSHSSFHDFFFTNSFSLSKRVLASNSRDTTTCSYDESP